MQSISVWLSVVGLALAALAAVVVLFVAIPRRELVAAAVAYVLMATSAYHIVFGEARLADTGKWWKQAVNSREVTIPAQSAALAAVYWWSVAGTPWLKWLVLYAAFTLLGILKEGAVDDAVDWLGALGGAALLVWHCRGAPKEAQPSQLLQ